MAVSNTPGMQGDRSRGRASGDDMSMMTADYAVGEQAAVRASKGQVEPEFLPQNWLAGRVGRQYVAAASASRSVRWA